MSFDYATLLTTLKAQFGAAILGTVEFRGQHTVRIARDANVAVLTFLRDDPAAKFAMLTDVTCVDALKLPPEMAGEYPERFAVVYHLTSLDHGARLRVKAYVPEDPCEIASVSGLWHAANWGEREAYDFYGVNFKGHPDLQRILMPLDFEGHPLRKDYPLKGRGERDNFPKYEVGAPRR
jgi:NADH-quinone oxidoreductase subunit C